MTSPGGRLRVVCARLCSAKTMERLINPVLADLRAEYGEALRRGQVWRSRCILVAGYVAFVKVIALYGCERSMRTLREWPVDDRQAFGRTIGFAVAGIVAVMVLLVFWPALRTLQRHAGQMDLVVYSIPQGLPIAIPVGLTLGVFCGLGGRVVSPRLTGLVLATALACSVASFATMAWVVPAAGDAWRLSVARRVSLTKGASVSLTRGPLELTLSELRQQVDSNTKAGRTTYAAKLRHAYHMRWALPFATFALALFALSVMPRRPVRAWVLGGAACGACLCYYFLLAAGEMVGRQGTLPAFAGAWLPNVVFAVASAALLIAGSHRSSAIPVK